MNKSNFDRYLDEQMRDPGFAASFEKASDAWDVALQIAALKDRPGNPAPPSPSLCAFASLREEISFDKPAKHNRGNPIECRLAFTPCHFAESVVLLGSIIALRVAVRMRLGLADVMMKARLGYMP